MMKTNDAIKTNNTDIDFSRLKLVHTASVAVRWRDLDDFGHVNNSVYFTYFEQARVEWWTSLGMNLKSKEQGPVLITAECVFIKPIFHPTDLVIKVYAGLPGNSSYIIYYEIFLASHSTELIAKGSTKVVWVNYLLGKSLPLPNEFRELLSEKSSP